jgi:hypothetical protein
MTEKGNSTMASSRWLPRSFIDFHIPTKWIGFQLKGVTKECYDVVVTKIQFFYSQSKFNEYLLIDVITSINQIAYKLEKTEFVDMMKQLLIFLRHQLLLKDPIVYYCTIKIIDYMIRFCGYYAQLLINNNKILLKTLAITALRQKAMDNRR